MAGTTNETYQGDHTTQSWSNRTIEIGGNYVQNMHGDVARHVYGNDATQVDGNQTTAVTGNQTLSVSANRNVSVSANLGEAVSGNKTVGVSGNAAESVSGTRSVTVSGTLTHTVAGAVALSGAADITQTAGANYAATAGSNAGVQDRVGAQARRRRPGHPSGRQRVRQRQRRDCPLRRRELNQDRAGRAWRSPAGPSKSPAARSTSPAVWSTSTEARVDPITRASRAFLAEADAFWRAGKGPLLPMIAAASARGDLVKTLRLAELALSNRRPLFVYEEPFVDARVWAAGLAAAIAGDYQAVREGAEKEGVTLPPFPAAGEGPSEKDPPLARAVWAMERAAALLAERLDGVLVALLPKTVADARAYREAVATLAAIRFSPRVRLAVHAPPGGPLDGVLGTAPASRSIRTRWPST